MQYRYRYKRNTPDDGGVGMQYETPTQRSEGARARAGMVGDALASLPSRRNLSLRTPKLHVLCSGNLGKALSYTHTLYVGRHTKASQSLVTRTKHTNTNAEKTNSMWIPYPTCNLKSNVRKHPKYKGYYKSLLLVPSSLSTKRSIVTLTSKKSRSII